MNNFLLYSLLLAGALLPRQDGLTHFVLHNSSDTSIIVRLDWPFVTDTLPARGYGPEHESSCYYRSAGYTITTANKNYRVLENTHNGVVKEGMYFVELEYDGKVDKWRTSLYRLALDKELLPTENREP